MSKSTKSSSPMPKPKMPRMTGGAGSGVGRAQKSHVPLVRGSKK